MEEWKRGRINRLNREGDSSESEDGERQWSVQSKEEWKRGRLSESQITRIKGFHGLKASDGWHRRFECRGWKVENRDFVGNNDRYSLR